MEYAGSLKEGASILTVQEAIDEIRPKACIMIGIAYGENKETQEIGDVLISERIQPYDSVRVSTGIHGETLFEDRNKAKEPGRIIKTQFVNYICPSKHYNVYHGTLLSGEMEGVGLSSALARVDNLNWMIVKAICDWADGNKKEGKREKQETAAKNVVDFCMHLFSTDMLCQIDGIKTVKSS